MSRIDWNILLPLDNFGALPGFLRNLFVNLARLCRSCSLEWVDDSEASMLTAGKILGVGTNMGSAGA
jgi:hypothetical protein